ILKLILILILKVDLDLDTHVRNKAKGGGQECPPYTKKLLFFLFFEGRVHSCLTILRGKRRLCLAWRTSAPSPGPLRRDCTRRARTWPSLIRTSAWRWKQKT